MSLSDYFSLSLSMFPPLVSFSSVSQSLSFLCLFSLSFPPSLSFFRLPPPPRCPPLSLSPVHQGVMCSLSLLFLQENTRRRVTHWPDCHRRLAHSPQAWCNATSIWQSTSTTPTHICHTYTLNAYACLHTNTYHEKQYATVEGWACVREYSNGRQSSIFNRRSNTVKLLVGMCFCPDKWNVVLKTTFICFHSRYTSYIL